MKVPKKLMIHKDPFYGRDDFEEDQILAFQKTANIIAKADSIKDCIGSFNCAQTKVHWKTLKSCLPC